MVMDHCLKMILVNMSNVYSPKSRFHKRMFWLLDTSPRVNFKLNYVYAAKCLFIHLSVTLLPHGGMPLPK